MVDQEKSTPKDVFLHLSAIVALYASIISFITVWFQYINVLLPDKLNFHLSSSLGSIRWASSVLIVTFPLYILISWILAREYRKNLQKRTIKIRKWLLYFTLFISALTIAIDLVTLIFYFYSGGLTLRFILKVFVLLAVALAVFGYYLWELRSDGEIPQKRNLQYGWIISAIVIGSIIAGFFIVGSPAEQRNIQFDEDRIMDLQFIQSHIIDYWVAKDKLPENLSDLVDSISGYAPPVDPQTDESYEYNVLGNLVFELCANFKTKSLRDIEEYANLRAMPAKPYSQFPSENWSYDPGRNCFQREIDPDLYSIDKSKIL